MKFSIKSKIKLYRSDIGNITIYSINSKRQALLQNYNKTLTEKDNNLKLNMTNQIIFIFMNKLTTFQIIFLTQSKRKNVLVVR